MTTIDNRFIQVPLWVLETGVSGNALKLYVWLGKYANWDDGLCYPSRATLAEKVGVKSVRSVDAYVKELVAVGAITVRARVDERGDPTSNEYHVLTAPPRANSCATPPANDCATGSAGDCTLTRPSSTKTQSEPLSPPPSEPHQGAGHGEGEKLWEDVPLPLGGVSPEPVAEPVQEPVVASRRAPSRPIPDDWKPTPEHVERASQSQLDVSLQAEKFKAHAATVDRRCANWNAAFTQWLIRATEMSQSSPRTTPTTSSRSSWMTPKKG